MRKLLLNVVTSLSALALFVPADNTFAFHGSKTYELRITPYCKPGTYCGYRNFNHLEQAVKEIVQEINVEWAHSGISFTHTLMPVDSTSPETEVGYCADSLGGGKLPVLCQDNSDCTGLGDCVLLADEDNYWKIGDGCAKDEIGGPLRVHWQQYVSDTSESIPVLLIAGVDSSWCCGGPYGIHCNAYGGGRLWAHELSHVFCGNHTFQSKVLDSSGNEVGLQRRFVDAPEYYPDGIVDHDGDKLPDTPPDPGSFESLRRHCSNLRFGVESIECVKDSECQTEYGPGSLCEVCAEFRCSEDTTVSCTQDSDCSASNAGVCVCNPHKDENVDYSFREGHEWCDTDLKYDVDMGSPHESYCEPDCRIVTAGIAEDAPKPWAKTELALTYYWNDCRGPYVVDGVRYDIFTPDGVENVKSCIGDDFPGLVDVCDGRDFDHDGVCDDIDTCPLVQNYDTQTRDSDEDGIFDGCDNCPAVANPDQANVDHDQYGDVCDDDIDNDGCDNLSDQHEFMSATKIGTATLAPNCSPGTDTTIYGFEGTTLTGSGDDPDGDGFVNCEDYDDDNDGLCDDDENLLAGEKPGVPASGCEGPDPCPRCDQANDPGCALTCYQVADCPVTAWWLTCGGSSSCSRFFLRISSAINPDPTTTVIIPEFRIVNRTIYATTSPLRTSSELALAIPNLAEEIIQPPAISAVQSALTAGIRLEIWQLPSEPGNLPRLYNVIGEYGSSAISVGSLGRGDYVRLIPEEDESGNMTLYVDTTYTIGLEVGEQLADRDTDSWPDVLDNCLDIFNNPQWDDDDDGIGNVCDPDLDNDCEVTNADSDLVRSCLGADLTVLRELTDEDPPPDILQPHIGPSNSVESILASHCRVADLNADEQVDESDVTLVEENIGNAMGVGCIPGAYEPFELLNSDCVGATTLEKAELAVRRLDLDPGFQNLQLKGEGILNSPLHEGHNPVDNGLQFLLRTAQGRAIVDSYVPPGEYDDDAEEGWQLTSHGAVFVSEMGINGISFVKLNWGDKKTPGAVSLEVQGKDGDYQLSEFELPLFARIIFDKASLATDQCVETDFGLTTAGMNCQLQNSAGNNVICR